MLHFVASAPRGLTDLLAGELSGFGATDVRDRGSSVSFTGELAVGYRACLWSRTASRILLEVARFAAHDVQHLYDGARAVDWRPHVDPQRTLACAFSGELAGVVHGNFGALRLKDAVCDQLRETTGTRPDIDAAQPDVRLHAHAHRGEVIVSLDLAGEGLHRAAIGATPARHRCARTWRPASCCAQAGRRSRPSTSSCSIRSAGRVRS